MKCLVTSINSFNAEESPTAAASPAASASASAAGEDSPAVDVNASAHEYVASLTAEEREHHLEMAEVLASKPAGEVDEFWQAVGQDDPEHLDVARASFDILATGLNLPDVEVPATLATSPLTTEWLIEGGLWARRDQDELSPGAKHWKVGWGGVGGGGVGWGSRGGGVKG